MRTESTKERYALDTPLRSDHFDHLDTIHQAVTALHTRVCLSTGDFALPATYRALKIKLPSLRLNHLDTLK